jgi:hypothetical protein
MRKHETGFVEKTVEQNLFGYEMGETSALLL